MFNLDQLYQEAQGEEPHFLSDLADPNQNSSFTLLRLKGANEIFFYMRHL